MNKLQKLAVAAQAKTICALNRAKSKLREDGGAHTTTEILVWILGGLAIAAVVIVAVIAMTKDEILPGFKDKVMEILNLGS